METASNILVGIVALEHFGFLVLEMFFWQSPYALKAFKLTKAQAQQTASLAKNQGLYNGFLSLGLFWSICNADFNCSLSLKNFFLFCVIVAGIFGAATVNKRIFWVQAAPAIVALLSVWVSIIA
jgi:putative membrane protein